MDVIDNNKVSLDYIATQQEYLSVKELLKSLMNKVDTRKQSGN